MDEIPIVLSGIAVFIIGMVILYLTRERSIQVKIGTLPIRILSAIFYAIGAGLIGILAYFTLLARNPLHVIIGLGYVYLMTWDQILRWLMLDKFAVSSRFVNWLFIILLAFVIPFLGLAAMYYFVVRTLAFIRTPFHRNATA